MGNPWFLGTVHPFYTLKMKAHHRPATLHQKPGKALLFAPATPARERLQSRGSKDQVVRDGAVPAFSPELSRVALRRPWASIRAKSRNAAEPDSPKEN